MKTIQEQIAVMQAYADGKKVECKIKTNEKGWRTINAYELFNFEKYDYRIKEEPKYRPFKGANECWHEMLQHAPFGWVVQKSNGIRRQVIAVGECFVAFTHEYAYKDAVNDYTFTDGTPFGIKED